jgi:hypothetical protein
MPTDRTTFLSPDLVETTLRHFKGRTDEYRAAAARVQQLAAGVKNPYRAKNLNPENELLMAQFLHQKANLSQDPNLYFSPEKNGRENGAANRYAEVRGMVQRFNPELLTQDLSQADHIRYGFVRPEVQQLEMALHHLHRMSSQFIRNIFQNNVINSDVFGSGAKPVLVQIPGHNDTPAHEKVVLQVSLPDTVLRGSEDKNMALALARLHEATAPNKNHLRGISYGAVLKTIEKLDPVFDACIEQFHQWLPSSDAHTAALADIITRNAQRESLRLTKTQAAESTTALIQREIGGK